MVHEITDEETIENILDARNFVESLMDERNSVDSVMDERNSAETNEVIVGEAVSIHFLILILYTYYLNILRTNTKFGKNDRYIF